jgi:hypothetical protein
MSGGAPYWPGGNFQNWNQTGQAFSNPQYGNANPPGSGDPIMSSFSPPGNPAAGGVGQTGNWMQDTGQMGFNANPPAGGGVSATGPFMQNNAAITATDASPGAPSGGTPSPALARAPASGPPMGYGQPSPMMGGMSNPAGFGGIGGMYGGQRPGIGARYWARLNNIGGS